MRVERKVSDGLIWLLICGIMYQTSLLIFSEKVQSSLFLSSLFTLNIVFGIYVLFRLKVKNLSGIEWIHPIAFTGIGFSSTFPIFIATYPNSVIGLGWVLFLITAIKIAFDFIELKVEIIYE